MCAQSTCEITHQSYEPLTKPRSFERGFLVCGACLSRHRRPYPGPLPRTGGVTFWIRMQPSVNAYNLAKEAEGLRLSAYPDPGSGADPWTIGYGSTRGVKKGMTVTAGEANARLAVDMSEAGNAVTRWVDKPLNQNQYDALCDFVFNLGEGNFRGSTLLKKLNAGDYAGAAAEFGKWVKASGRTLPGLVTRRAAERALFERTV